MLTPFTKNNFSDRRTGRRNHGSKHLNNNVKKFILSVLCVLVIIRFIFVHKESISTISGQRKSAKCFTVNIYSRDKSFTTWYYYYAEFLNKGPRSVVDVSGAVFFTLIAQNGILQVRK